MSVRAPQAAPRPPAKSNASGARLEAVLAAGMTHMALVPTAMPKRDDRDLAALLEEVQEAEARQARRAQEAQARQNRAAHRGQGYELTVEELEKLVEGGDEEDAPDYTDEELANLLAREQDLESAEELARFTPDNMLEVVEALEREDNNPSPAEKNVVAVSELEAAVDALVRRWDEQGGVSATQRSKDVTELRNQLGNTVSSNSIYLELARRHPRYARPQDRRRIGQ